MYLHLGQGVVIRQQEILGIFDMDNTTVSRNTRDFLAAAEKAGRVVTVSPELPRSFVLCCDRYKGGRRSGTEDTVYVAQLSPRTLYKRAGMALTDTDGQGGTTV